MNLRKSSSSSKRLLKNLGSMVHHFYGVLIFWGNQWSGMVKWITICAGFCDKMIPHYVSVPLSSPDYQNRKIAFCVILVISLLHSTDSVQPYVLLSIFSSVAKFLTLYTKFWIQNVRGFLLTLAIHM